MSSTVANDGIIHGINWNSIDDPFDLEVWNKVTQNFWLPEAVPVSNDLQSWGNLSEEDRWMTSRVFTGLTVLDTLQGRYGMTSLMEDAQTQHEEAVLANFSFMEAFSGDTELLTPSGWKQIKDVTAEDKVAQYSPESNTLEFVSPKPVPSHFADEVYEIRTNNGNARQVVSGGHRVYYEEKVKCENGCDTWIPKVAEARDLKNINLNSQHRRFRSTGLTPAGEGLTVEDRLKIAVQADGSFSGSSPRHTGERGGCIPVHFALAKERKIERLTALAEIAGWELRALADKHFTLMVPVDHVGDREKHFDSWWSLDEISSTWAQEFVEESGLWDGHTLVGGQGVTYYTNSRKNSDFYVAVASLAGYRSRTMVRTDDRSDVFSDSYVTYVSFSKDTVNGQSIVVEPAEPQQVYCVQVPSSYLLTRNGESPVVSGNCVHAKSYSSIFSTLLPTKEINAAFEWSENNDNLQKKANAVLEHYQADDPDKKKVASVMLESFLFYSGFYAPMYWSSRGELNNTADMIKLIIRDEAVHGTYIGHLLAKSVSKQSPQRQREIKQFAHDLFDDLYEIEKSYTAELYDDIGLTGDVRKFLRYNANKAFQNMRYDAPFSQDEVDVNPAIVSAVIDTSGSTHDFFSSVGDSYVLATVQETDDEDWE